MRISSIKLGNWKNFRSAHTELRDRTFIIGPNASGKSNFLDAFRFLRDLTTDGLKSAVSKRGGVSSIRCLAARRDPSITIEITIVSDDGVPLWIYGVSIIQDSNRQPLIKEEYARDLTENREVLNRPDSDDELDPDRKKQSALEQINANKVFRAVAEFLRTISYQHIIPQVVRDPQGFSVGPVQNDPYGRDFLLRVWQTNKRTRDSRLNKIAKVLRAAVPDLTELFIEMDRQGVPHLVARFLQWRAKGSLQNEAQLSDGTLRLFGLMWTIFEGNGPLLLEEPELSLHDAVIRHLPGLFENIEKSRGRRRRQFIISTHSEALLQDKSVAAEELLRIEPTDDGSVICGPSKEDKSLMKDGGLSAADVMLPKTSPPSIDQLLLPL